MGQKLGAAELARADVVIRPAVNDIGAADFAQRSRAALSHACGDRPKSRANKACKRLPLTPTSAAMRATGQSAPGAAAMAMHRACRRAPLPAGAK